MMCKELITTENFKNSVKHPELAECEFNIKNIGWSLGNECPCRCKQCYSSPVREKGKDITIDIVDRIISQIKTLNIKTVNLGGNEPWFTNGLNGDSLLPYILRELKKINVDIGITTAGITLKKLYNDARDAFFMVNDVDVSLDSPIEEEHNQNRDADVFKLALEALQIAKNNNMEKTIILCAMKWNFTKDRIDKLLMLAKDYSANIRFNVLKPVKKEHMQQMVDPRTFFENFQYLLNKCETIDITEPILGAAVNNTNSNRCPCGRTSLRIHSITPDGKVPVSPCVYLHDYKVGDILQDELSDIIITEPFKEFRRRTANPQVIAACNKCTRLDICGGGCIAKSYLSHYWRTGEGDIYQKEPGCYLDYKEYFDIDSFRIANEMKSLVHIDYLCTWIGKPI